MSLSHARLARAARGGGEGEGGPAKRDARIHQPASVAEQLAQRADQAELAQPASVLAGLWVSLFGFGAGACIILALMFMGLRTHDPRQAAALSGLAQCIGYLLAAFGPPLIGGLRDASQGWSLPLTVGLALAMAALGMLAGRDRKIPGGAEVEPRSA